MKNNISRIIIITAFIVLIPLVAMQFTDEVDWDLTDFIIASVLLIVIGLVYELSVKKIVNTKYRLLVAIVVGILFLLIWAELGVGIFRTPFTGS